MANFCSLALSSLLLLHSLVLSNSQTFPINVWPKPQNASWPIPKATTFSPHFQILSPLPLRPAADRCSRRIFSEHYHPIVPPSVNLTLSESLDSLTVLVSDLPHTLQHGADKSYTLSISDGRANLTARTVWGAMHGLETFSQLSWSDPPLVATGVFIYDRPNFAHRGIVLDTSRNFYPKKDVLRTIDAMAMNKLNVFHWHVTDSQSFPIVLPSEPELGEKGAYGEGMRYEVKDVKEIVEYGLSRGVRVMPEIDAPGHTESWAVAHPDIVTCANKFWLPGHWADRLASEPGTGQLNPLKPKTYKIFKNVITDIAALFPENFYHSGADEVVPGCWKDDPTIQAFLAQEGNTLSKLLEIFINGTYPLIMSLNRTAVYWEDVLLDPIIKVNPSILPAQSTILQTWNNGPDNTKRIVQAGYRAIVSSSDFYYLDCGHGDFVGNDSR